MHVRRDHTESGAQPVLVLSGALDARTSGAAREQLHEVLADGTGDLVVDVAALTALDAAGVGVLVGLHRRAEREGRRLVVAGVPPRLARVLAATRLRGVLRVEPARVPLRSA